MRNPIHKSFIFWLVVTIVVLESLLLFRTFIKIYYPAWFGKGNSNNKVEYKDKLVDGIPVMQRCAEVGWENCLKKLDIECDVAFYGNSITRQSDFREYFSDLKIVNLGYGGDNLAGLRRRIGMLCAVNPPKIFLMGGINDMLGISISDFEIQYRDLLQTISDSLPLSSIYVQSILPVNSSRYNTYGTNEKIDSCNIVLSRISKDYNAKFINLYDLYLEDGQLPMKYTNDGIHLKTEAYKLWADAIYIYIYE